MLKRLRRFLRESSKEDAFILDSIFLQDWKGFRAGDEFVTGYDSKHNRIIYNGEKSEVLTTVEAEMLFYDKKGSLWEYTDI